MAAWRALIAQGAKPAYLVTTKRTKFAQCAREDLFSDRVERRRVTNVPMACTSPKKLQPRAPSATRGNTQTTVLRARPATRDSGRPRAKGPRPTAPAVPLGTSARALAAPPLSLRAKTEERRRPTNMFAPSARKAHQKRGPQLRAVRAQRGATLRIPGSTSARSAPTSGRPIPANNWGRQSA